MTKEVHPLLALLALELGLYLVIIVTHNFIWSDLTQAWLVRHDETEPWLNYSFKRMPFRWWALIPWVTVIAYFTIKKFRR